MDTRMTYLVSGAVGLGMFVGGLVLGNVLRDDEPSTPARPATVEIAAATPADPDSGPDGPSTIDWPMPSTRQLPANLVVPNPVNPSPSDEPGDDPPAGSGGVTLTGLASAGDHLPSSPFEDQTEDEDAHGVPYRPPTVPGGLDADGVGEPDPDAPFVVADGVEELTAEDLFGPGIPEPTPAPTPTPTTTPPAPADPPFRDPCADIPEEAGEEADEACPEGIGGTILLIDDADPPAPLHIMRQFYTSIGVPLELRCPDLGTSADGIYRPLFSSNNPADFTIRYFPSTRRDDVRQITFRSSEAELDRWIDRRIAGSVVSSDLHGGVHNCPEFPLPDPFPTNGHFTFEIEGVDDFGSTYSVVVYATVPSPEAALGRPPVGFTPRRPVDGRPVGILTVPYDPTREVVHVTAIPKDGPRGSDRTCTSIEGDWFDGRLPLDASIGRVGTAIMARAPGAPAFDPIYSQAVTAEVWGVEGTRYELCTWVVTPPVRSFDRPTVVQRSSITVRAPRQLRVRVSVGGGHADQDLEARSVWVTAANWPGLTRGTFPASDLPGRRAFMLDAPVPMIDSGGWSIPSSTIIEVRGPNGATQLIDVPTPIGCLDLGFMSVCPGPGALQYDVPIPGDRVGRGTCSSGMFGSCDPPPGGTFVGNLRLIVERYAGPGGPPDGSADDDWVVDPPRSFGAGAARARPEIPQIDNNASYLRAIAPSAGGRPGLAMNLVFDRPVRLEATPRANFETPCVEPVTYSSDVARTAHTYRWPELCWKGTYSLSLLAIDEDGNELDMLPSGEDRPGPGHPGYGFVELPGFPIAEFSLDIAIDRLGDGMRPQSLSVSVGGVSAGTLIAPGHPPRCRTTLVPSSTFSPRISGDGGRPITWGDSVPLRLEVAGTGDGFNCGLDERFVRIQLFEQLWLDDLLARPEHTFVYDAPDGEITVTIRNIVRR